MRTVQLEYPSALIFRNTFGKGGLTKAAELSAGIWPTRLGASPRLEALRGICKALGKDDGC
jgi:hypothetical protein